MNKPIDKVEITEFNKKMLEDWPILYNGYVIRLVKKGCLIAIPRKAKCFYVSIQLGIVRDVKELKKIIDEEINKELENPVMNKNIYLSALEESLKLQTHYAKLLNQYDGGKRIIFKSVSEWLKRLKIK